MTVPRLLVVEDEEELRVGISEGLEERGQSVVVCADAEAALRALEHLDFDVVITDFMMPGMNGIELCRRLAGDRPGIPVIVMTAFGDVRAAVDALHAGAFDFIAKPFRVDDLWEILTRALAREPETGVLTRLPEYPPSFDESESLVGSSLAMRSVIEQISRAARTESTVLITGETGTGKELVARAIHLSSKRRHGPFIAISCAAVPQDILEAELFGYAAGAFTGASVAHAGLLRAATGGTLFLDEIGDMPQAIQPKLLRALQERSFRPLGAQREYSFDARVVAATNEDLEQAILSGEFRRDLYFRIKVLQIHLPPLRERDSDVIELALHFLAQASKGATEYKLAPETEPLLRAHAWPGNVRELENCVLAGTALAVDGLIGCEELGIVPLISGPGEDLRVVARQYIERVVRAVGGNKTIAAQKLGIDRATLYRKLGRSRAH